MRLEKDGTAIFEINDIGDDTNQTYLGTFRVKCVLSPLEFISSDKTRRELLGLHQEFAIEHTKNLALALAQLQYRVMESPAFWKNKTIDGGHVDDNIILLVFERAIEAQTLFKNEKTKLLEEMQQKLSEKIKKKEITPEIETEQEPESDAETEEMNSQLKQIEQPINQTFDEGDPDADE
jgi:hypothetical protein